MGEDLSFEVWSGFSLFFIVSGVLLNSLLLTSVIYAKIKKQHNFDNSDWISSTVFIVNLGVVDLCYCLVNVMHGIYAGFVAHSSKSQNYDIGSTYEMCEFISLSKQVLAIIDGWSTAAIAFNTAFPKIW